MRLTVCSDADVIGGSEVALRHLLGALGPGIEVAVVGTSPDVIDLVTADPDREGVITRVLDVGRASSLERVARWRRAIAGTRPDVVHLNMTSPWSCTAPLAALTSWRAPGVVALHHLPMVNPSRSSRALLRALYRRVDIHVAVGCGAARLVEEHQGLAPSSVRPVHLGVRAPTCAGPAAFDGHTRHRIGTVARLTGQKGIDVLIRALPDVPGATLVVVGDGPARGDLEGLAADVGVGDRVRFTGWSSHAAALLASFDAFCLPSRFEGLPLAIMEAMHAGVPVVATDVGSVREAVLPGVTGLLVPPDDVGALAAALRTLLDDPALSERLADAAHRHACRHFTAAAMAASFEAVYAEAAQA